MKKISYFAAALFAAFTVGCAHTASTAEGHNHAEETEAHEGHNHAEEGESHEGHNHAEEATAHEGHNHEEHEGSEGENKNEIVFTPQQAAMTDFEVQTVEPTTFSQTIKCSGEISAATGKLQVVAATSTGIVRLAEGVKEGVDVSGGKRLMTVSSSSLASGDNIKMAEAAYNKALSDYERSKRLYQDKIIGQREYTEAETAYLNAKSVWEPLSKSENGAVVISAPAGGYISELLVRSGDYVEMGQRVAAITSGERMQLEALVPKRYFEELKSVNDAVIRSASGTSASVSQMGGSLVAKGKAMSVGSNMIPVLFEFNGNGRYPAGDIVEVSLIGKPIENAITVPLTAITEQQGLYYLYVRLDEECYEAREVKLGGDDGRSVEILSGLSAGETVVTKGAINVKMASFSGAIPEGHNHSH